jgi:hypothetical protein
MGPNTSTLKFEDIANKRYKCVVVLKTYWGGMDALKLKKMYTGFDALQYKAIETIRLGRDGNFALKQRFDPLFPEYQVEMAIIREPVNIKVMESWAP